MKPRKFNWLYIKIGLYGALLYSVASVMQYVKSSSFSGNMEVLMGSPSQSRQFHWCSESVQIIFLMKPELKIQKTELVKELCLLSYSSYDSSELGNIKWQPFMKSFNAKGEEIVLYSNPELSFVRQGSLVYKVDGLKSKLVRLGLSQN